ncbi:MAG TPA: hypothetical protein VFD30_03615 [Terriglobia bacterium]|nr:hypothetical protein [Terriglobia bacterium]
MRAAPTALMQMLEANPRLANARAFARTLNILLKTARLYGLEHDRTTSHFNTAWNELHACLQGSGEEGLLLGVSGSQVLLDGVPLEAKPSERSFAQMLSSSGLSSIQFSSRVTPDDFARFVRAFATRGPKPADLVKQLRSALGNTDKGPISINEVRFVAQDGALAEAGLAAQLAARSLGEDASKLQNWLEDPTRLLELIAAAEGAHGGGNSSSAGTNGGSNPTGPVTGLQKTSVQVPPDSISANEEDISRIIQLLSRLGQAEIQGDKHVDAGFINQEVHNLPAASHVTLAQALASLAAVRPSERPDTPLLVQLAEHIAVRFALERFERGDVKINAVVELLDRMKKEISALRKVLVIHEEKMNRAGIAVDSYAEILDRQFWSGLPASAKKKVLLSPEAWAIPPRNIRQFTQELLERGEASLARDILLNYATCLHNPQTGARHKTAVGLTDLIDLYIRVDPLMLQEVILHLGEQLNREAEAELEGLLGAALVRFSHEAGTQHRFTAVHQALLTVEELGQARPALAQTLWPRIKVGFRLNEFLEEALRSPRVPADLLEVLRRMPHATAEQATRRLSRCSRREEREVLVNLLRDIGNEGVTHLRRTLCSRPAPEAAPTVAFLSRLAPQELQESLKGLLRDWDRLYHDQVVRQLALGGAPERGKLLAHLLNVLDPSVMPEAIDEIGLCGDPTTSSCLLHIVEGAVAESREDYLLVKAIEALGRLREAKSFPLLRSLAEDKQLWRWRHQHELRITATQALSKIDPEWGSHFIPQSGLDAREMMLAPLEASPDSPWLRQRRYVRIQLSSALAGSVTSPQGKYPVEVEELSLGGGLAACQRHLKPGTVMQIEFRPGWNSIRAQVLVREARPQQMSFEMVAIELADRCKLRRPLAGLHLRREHSPAACPGV